MDPRFDRLSKRQRESLRGVSALKGSKEIAQELGIEKSTVDGYIAEAVRSIGARNRRDAARQFEIYEAKRSVFADPDKIGGDSARLAIIDPSLPVPVVPDEQSSRQRQPSETTVEPRNAGSRLPFRQKGHVGNPLTAGERLIWIQVIAVGLAIGFGMLATGLQVLTGVIATVSRLFH